MDAPSRSDARMPAAGSIPQSGPIAFFLTWTAYGSWLPGDPRGWVDHHGQFRGADGAVQAAAARRLAERPVTFTVGQRTAIEAAIRRHCDNRGWLLHAVQCRQEHVHVVVSAPEWSPDDVMQQLKSWCTRALNAAGRGVPFRKRWWTEGGSRRHVLDERDLEATVTYVKACQGAPTVRKPEA